MSLDNSKKLLDAVESLRGLQLQDLIRGSIVMMSRTCGKDSCRCKKGRKHRSMYISQRYKGKTRMIYVPKEQEARVRKLIENYQKLKKMMDDISDINLGMLTKKKK